MQTCKINRNRDDYYVCDSAAIVTVRVSCANDATHENAPVLMCASHLSDVEDGLLLCSDCRTGDYVKSRYVRVADKTYLPEWYDAEEERLERIALSLRDRWQVAEQNVLDMLLRRIKEGA